MEPTTQKPVALITGAASGIGRQLALDLARDGYTIAGLDVSSDGLQSLHAELQKIGTASAVTTADVTDMAALSTAVADLEAQLGPTDLLIASAGIGRETSGLDYRAEDIARVISINLIGVSNSIGAVLPGMIARRRGHLVALSSVASFRGLPRMIAYSASKAGVNALMDGLRVELRDQGIAVTTICPGWIRTPMTEPIQGRLAHLMEVDVAARRILHAIRTKARFCTFPRRLAWRLRFLTWLPLAWQDRIIAGMVGKLKVAK